MTISLPVCALITITAIILMVVLESWGDIQKWRQKRWEEKCKRRKIIV
jgi:hypothetical protein